jgi:hypothetical protein
MNKEAVMLTLRRQTGFKLGKQTYKPKIVEEYACPTVLGLWKLDKIDPLKTEATYNTGVAKVAAQCFAGTFVFNRTMVLAGKRYFS